MRTIRTVIVPGRPTVDALAPGAGIIQIPLRGRPAAISLRLAGSGLRSVGIQDAAVLDIAGTVFDAVIGGFALDGNYEPKDSTNALMTVYTSGVLRTDVRPMSNGFLWTGRVPGSQFNGGIGMSLPGVFLFPGGAKSTQDVISFTDLQPDVGSWQMNAAEDASIPRPGEVHIPGAFALIVPLKGGFTDVEYENKQLELHFLNYACAPGLIVVEVIY